MVVEIFLRPSNDDAKELPDRVTELEMRLEELKLTLAKLKESTDLLTEEFHKTSSDDNETAKEYYEYIQDNLIIMGEKSKLADEIQAKINAIRGIVPVVSKSEHAGGSVEDSGHFI